MTVASDLYARPTLGIDESDRAFSVAKLFFAYGLGNGLYFPFRVGATTVLFPGRPEPEAVFGVIDKAVNRQMRRIPFKPRGKTLRFNVGPLLKHCMVWQSTPSGLRN